jgi:hypothetical protein
VLRTTAAKSFAGGGASVPRLQRSEERWRGPHGPNHPSRRQVGEKLAPEQLKGLIRAGYVYRNGDEHFLTDMGRNALAQPGVLSKGSSLAERPDPQMS